MHKKQGAVSNPKCNGLINRGKLSLSHLYQNFRVSLQMHSESLHFIGVLLVLQYIQGVPDEPPVALPAVPAEPAVPLEPALPAPPCVVPAEPAVDPVLASSPSAHATASVAETAHSPRPSTNDLFKFIPNFSNEVPRHARDRQAGAL